MRYIGNKTKLVEWIYDVIKQHCNKDLNKCVFADVFAGTGSVSLFMKDKVKSLIVNDLEYYSYVINKFYIENNIKLCPKIKYNDYEGGVYYNYSPKELNFGRMFFTEKNAKAIDGFRKSIEEDFKQGVITDNEYYCLLTSLIEAVDKVSNTTSVYGAYLKTFQKNALNNIHFTIPETKIVEKQINLVYNCDANDLIKSIKGDILYLDPPYNHRQYSSNYHVLNNILTNSNFESNKKSGVNNNNKSKYSMKKEAIISLEDLVKNANFKYIFISYNDDGIISLEDFKKVLEKYGKYHIEKKEYKRYKSNNNTEQKKTVYEYLHILTK